MQRRTHVPLAPITKYTKVTLPSSEIGVGVGVGVGVGFGVGVGVGVGFGVGTSLL
jgi:hypothetical protein